MLCHRERVVRRSPGGTGTGRGDGASSGSAFSCLWNSASGPPHTYVCPSWHIHTALPRAHATYVEAAPDGVVAVTHSVLVPGTSPGTGTTTRSDHSTDGCMAMYDSLALLYCSGTVNAASEACSVCVCGGGGGGEGVSLATHGFMRDPARRQSLYNSIGR